MQQLIQSVGHPHVRASFDPGLLLHLNESIQLDVASARLAGMIKYVRLRDAIGPLQELTSPELGTGGAVPFMTLYRTLSGCGFKGPYVIQAEPPPAEPVQPADVYDGRVRRSLEYLMSIGYGDRLPHEPAPQAEAIG